MKSYSYHASSLFTANKKANHLIRVFGIHKDEMRSSFIILSDNIVMKIDLPLSYRIKDFRSRFNELVHRQFITY